MRVEVKSPPRLFRVGTDGWVEIRDCGRVLPEGDATLSLSFADTGIAAHVVARNWGWEIDWAHGPAPAQEVEAYIAGRSLDRMHILLVKSEHRAAWQDYCRKEAMMLVAPLAVDGK